MLAARAPVSRPARWNRSLGSTRDAYIVVFNDAADTMSTRGDSIQYILEREL